MKEAEHTLSLRPVSDNGGPLIAQVAHREQLVGGGVETKFFLEAFIPSSDEPIHLTHLFEKKMSASGILHYAEAWKAHKDAGIPVASALWTTDTSVVMPDVRASGYECYGKGLAYWLEDDDMPRNPKIQDEAFLALVSGTGLSRIEERALDYAERATRHGILLAPDGAFELLVDESGGWDLFALDLRLSDLRPPTGKTEENPYRTTLLIHYLRFLRIYLPGWRASYA